MTDGQSTAHIINRADGPMLVYVGTDGNIYRLDSENQQAVLAGGKVTLNISRREAAIARALLEVASETLNPILTAARASISIPSAVETVSGEFSYVPTYGNGEDAADEFD